MFGLYKLEISSYNLSNYNSNVLKSQPKTLSLLFFPHCCLRMLGQTYSKLHLPTAPPPLNEGESLVSRILQLGPPGTKFLG